MAGRQLPREACGYDSARENEEIGAVQISKKWAAGF
jgi:hypothetical protein